MSKQQEEIEEEFDEEMMEDDDEEYDPMGILTNLLATEDGDTICTALVTISKQLEVHNKIMVKLLSAVKDLKST